MSSAAVTALENRLFGPRCPGCGKPAQWNYPDQDGWYYCFSVEQLCNVVAFLIDGEIVSTTRERGGHDLWHKVRDRM